MTANPYRDACYFVRFRGRSDIDGGVWLKVNLAIRNDGPDR
jgi:hypothetical protein